MNYDRSTKKEIRDEPDWGSGHQHRIGFKNRQDRRPGLTHGDDELTAEDEEVRERVQELRNISDREKKGELINFRDIAEHEKDLTLGGRKKVTRPLGWRFVIDTSEDWVKKQQEWPANIQKREKEKKQQQEEEAKNTKDQKNNGEDNNDQKNDGKDDNDQKDPQQEHEWKRQQGENKHHDAYPSESKSEPKTEYQKLLEKYTPQEIALLRAIQHEEEYISKLEINDGKQKSPQHHNMTQVSIDEADQFSPDNWLPRSSHLLRLTGKHPLNGEPELQKLFDAGLITPNELHYVRNHGAVPRILWELHDLDVENGKLTLSMNDIRDRFDAINIPVALACDGNRRKELNMIRKSKGFSWGAGAVSCAYWKGALLRDVLLAAGVPTTMPDKSKRYYINFEGADEPSEGKYATCIPFEYGMDPSNDVLLAYEMNDQVLPPDHGFPLRLMIPGYVGGRCVKWLKKIWVSDKENDSHYHIWDNRVLPSFVTEKDGDFAETLFRHPDTACNEQNLNSVIVRPAQGEKIPLTAARKGQTYRITGYAYDGGGHEVQRVEVSLDDGKTWLYCIRRFPEKPIRHGNKFWTWVHWHVDVEITSLIKSSNVQVRCWNVFKNTQPREPSWNTMGMMNNCWYIVRHELVTESDSDIPCVLFRHPCEPGTGDGGWMKPSTENQLATVKQSAGSPQKQFTREEIEKHDTENDCWIVVDGKVYDATSVLKWHPGGKAAISGHAGKVHQQTSDEFASIHDDFAYQKLKECAIGVVTEKAMQYIKANAEANAKEMAKTAGGDDLRLQTHRWIPAKLLKRTELSKDTRAYEFELPNDDGILGLGTCQHVQVGFHLKDRMLIRSYTPTKPLLPRPQRSSGKADDEHDGCGTFELTVKTYFPTKDQPGGALSNILDCMPIGEQVELRGPTGEIIYNGNGKFVINDQEQTFQKISLVVGGSGLTPAYSLLARILLSKGDETKIRVVDANKSEADILLKGELDDFEKQHSEQLKITHVLSHPSDEWKGKKGHVNEDILKEALFEPGKGSAVFLCGPPAMIQKAALPALRGNFAIFSPHNRHANLKNRLGLQRR